MAKLHHGQIAVNRDLAEGAGVRMLDVLETLFILKSENPATMRAITLARHEQSEAMLSFKLAGIAMPDRLEPAPKAKKKESA